MCFVFGIQGGREREGIRGKMGEGETVKKGRFVLWKRGRGEEKSECKESFFRRMLAKKETLRIWRHALKSRSRYGILNETS